MQSVLLELHYGAKRGKLPKPGDLVTLTNTEPKDWDVLYTFQPLSSSEFLHELEQGVYEAPWSRMLNVAHGVRTR